MEEGDRACSKKVRKSGNSEELLVGLGHGVFEKLIDLAPSEMLDMPVKEEKSLGSIMKPHEAAGDLIYGIRREGGGASIPRRIAIVTF